MKLDKELLLYGITDRFWLGDRILDEVVEEALMGGVTFLQLREKELDENEFLQEGIRIKEICKKYKVPFVINDNVEIAKKVDADGVHLGQGDMDLQKAKEMLGKDKIIGISAQTLEEAKKAEEQGADYLGVGAIFSTSSKEDASTISMDQLREIVEGVNIPVVAIGGISYDNVDQLKGSGISGISVISAIFAQENIESATRQLRKKVESIL